jgi:hypothetical protein
VLDSTDLAVYVDLNIVWGKHPAASACVLCMDYYDCTSIDIHVWISTFADQHRKYTNFDVVARLDHREDEGISSQK